MLRSNTTSQFHSLIALTLLLTLCMASTVSAATTTQTTTLPIISNVQINLPSADKITINGTGFGTRQPTVTMGGSSLTVNAGFNNTKIVADLSRPPRRQPRAHDIQQNSSSLMFSLPRSFINDVRRSG